MLFLWIGALKKREYTHVDEAIVRDELRERLVGLRLRELRTQRELTQSELAKIAGKSKQLVSAWEAGRAEILSSTLAELAMSLEVDLNWLLTGKSSGGASPPHISASVDFQAGLAAHNSSGVPKLDQLAMWEVARGVKVVSDFPIWTHPISVCSDLAFAFEVFDDAMTPKIGKGDIVIVDRGVDPEDGDFALYALLKKKRLLFRKYLSNNLENPPLSRFDLIGTNIEFKQQSILHTDDPVLLGTMAECIRVGRR